MQEPYNHNLTVFDLLTVEQCEKYIESKAEFVETYRDYSGMIPKTEAIRCTMPDDTELQAGDAANGVRLGDLQSICCQIDDWWRTKGEQWVRENLT